eukprot:2482038-Amphidinium_carterae.1
MSGQKVPTEDKGVGPGPGGEEDTLADVDTEFTAFRNEKHAMEQPHEALCHNLPKLCRKGH